MPQAPALPHAVRGFRQRCYASQNQPSKRDLATCRASLGCLASIYTSIALAEATRSNKGRPLQHVGPPPCRQQAGSGWQAMHRAVHFHDLVLWCCSARFVCHRALAFSGSSRPPTKVSLLTLDSPTRHHRIRLHRAAAVAAAPPQPSQQPGLPACMIALVRYYLQELSKAYKSRHTSLGIRNQA